MATAFYRHHSERARRLKEAGRKSPLVYQSYDQATGLTTFRLADGQKFEIPENELKDVHGLRWRHLEGVV